MTISELTTRLTSCGGVMLDLDGTLALGDRESQGYRALPGAFELLDSLNRRGIPFVIFTNGTHHTPLGYVHMLRRAGFDIDDSSVMTPAVVAAEYFVRKRYRRVFVLGVQGVSQPLIDAGLVAVRPGDDESDVDATFVGWHPDFALRDLEAACRLAWTGAPLYTASAAPFFATRSGRAIGISAAICAAIRNATRQRVNVLGKPSLSALRAAARRLKVGTAQIVVVGDDPGLEIHMARAGGACAVGVLTGLATSDAFERLAADRRANLVVDGVADLLPYFAHDAYTNGKARSARARSELQT